MSKRAVKKNIKGRIELRNIKRGYGKAKKENERRKEGNEGKKMTRMGLKGKKKKGKSLTRPKTRRVKTSVIKQKLIFGWLLSYPGC